MHVHELNFELKQNLSKIEDEMIEMRQANEKQVATLNEQLESKLANIAQLQANLDSATTNINLLEQTKSDLASKFEKERLEWSESQSKF